MGLRLRSLAPLALLAGLISLPGCSSSSGSSTGGTSSLTGTAATGAPLVGLIRVRDQFGQERIVQSDAQGKFTLPTSTLTPPLMIEATPQGGGTPLYSFSDTKSGITVNVTPLTSLALYLGAGKKPLGEIFQNWSLRNQEITETKVTEAQKVINKNLRSQFRARNLDETSFDFFNEAFDANQQGFDAVLDGLSITIPTRAGVDPGIQVQGTPGFVFDPAIDVSDINLSPGAPGPSVNPTPGTGSETPATIPSHAAGTFNFTFSPGPNPTSLYTTGQQVQFTVGVDGTLSFQGTVLRDPVLRNGNPAEAIWKDPSQGVEYALSSINQAGVPPREINLSQDGTFNTFQGQFNDPNASNTQAATVPTGMDGTVSFRFFPGSSATTNQLALFSPSNGFNSMVNSLDSLNVTLSAANNSLTVNGVTMTNPEFRNLNTIDGIFSHTGSLGKIEFFVSNFLSGTLSIVSVRDQDGNRIASIQM